MGRLPYQFCMTISRYLKHHLWDLPMLLDLIRYEIRARKNIVLPSTTDQPDDTRNDGKNKVFFL